MVVKGGISEEMATLLRQLVQNGHVNIAGTTLYVYFVRNWQLDERLAVHFIVRYFQKYFHTQLERHYKKEAARSK